ncbi:glucosaminidase domain-containing protein [Selenomonas bovis]|uniref:glucosaminidase domain-containing protein n=1 Tax=Selenomonas bovis TaxID=416586 RepID=UPI000380C256|nr:glucosaminidase domain-containing protein [Selenomonas bovis]
MHYQRHLTLAPLALAACLFAAPVCTAAPVRAAAAEPTAALPADIAQRPIAGNVTIARPDFGRELPAEVNKKLINEVTFRLAPAYDLPLLPDEAAPETVTIFGPAEATQEQMAAFIRRRNPQPKLACTVEEIVRYYYAEAGREGIRPDVALCQALKETGFFAYGGDVLPAQNNFCGLGTTGGGVRGAKFATPELGVRAHIQHLLAYASRELPAAPIIDPRYELIVREHPDIHGQITHWTQLNGVWAVPGKTYGQDILRLWAAAKAPDGSDASLAAAMAKVKNAPDDASAYLYRGIVYEKRVDLTAAQSDFTAAHTLAPHELAALYDLALTATATGDRKQALALYDTLREEFPDFAPAAYNRGLLALAMNRPKDAIDDFRRALNANPQSAAAENAIAVARIAQHDYDAAWRTLHRAAQINNADFDVLANQILLAACVKQEATKAKKK